MPHTCSAFNCTARLEKGQNLKFHSFPKDEILRDQWIKAVGRIDFNPSSCSKICSNHFHHHDYFINVHGSKTLKKGAIPSIFSFSSYLPVRVNDEDSLVVDNYIEDDLPSTSTAKPKTGANKRKRRRESGSSDEERWLTAIESGKLEDVDDELKKIKPKDPSLMTARQRAIYDRGSEGTTQSNPTLMSLPTGYKEKVMTAEAIQKAAIKSQKRKQLADEKREKDKKKTMDRLLKKQDSKLNKGARNRTTKTMTPVISYRQSVNSTSMFFPENEFPLKENQVAKVPIPKYCGMECGNLRKYACSVTGVPLCSLECYNKNRIKHHF